jgi:hypothetical protein
MSDAETPASKTLGQDVVVDQATVADARCPSASVTTSTKQATQQAVREARACLRAFQEIDDLDAVSLILGTALSGC